MQPTMCSRCGKNVAVIFITKLEGSTSKNEGLCLKCAREMGIKPIDDMMKKMGISDEDLDNLTSEMMSAFGGAEGIDGMLSPAKDEDDGEDEGRTATFPFLSQLFGGGSSTPAPTPSEGAAPPPRGEKAAKPAKRKFLDSYCISLTQRAQEGKLDKLIGRERELERVVQILNRRQKNNPCLIGEPGVGKTAIAEGLAQRIANREVPYKLLDKEVYLLDLTALVAGTQFRGQFESRMKGLIEEIKKLGNIILVIDEVHTIVGAGDAEGSMNAANILKPALSRGEVQVIGATTLNEYRKHIEKDTALERRFQPVIVEEPSIEDSVKVIEGIVPYYESFHQVAVSPAMCRLAVTMSERYITDRYLPDKAIDLIDEACSNVNLHNKALARLNEVDKELADLAKEKEVMMAAATEDSYKRLADIKSLELRLAEEKESLQNDAHPALTQENLANVIELWTNIPASRIQEQEFQRLARLEERLEEHVIGQDEAVKAVSAAIRRGRVGISPKRKPVSFIFVGSTGVGKTELVKQLAADLFDTPESLIRLDMSEFMEKHAVSRIIGSPPGYVGYDEAGQLTEKIRRKPYSVVLFDEIEKAHPDVLNILLQILDDGRITDAHGRTVNFENTVIVMTTNAGSNTKVGSVGFGRTANEQGRDRALKALNDFLRPEFINRVDEIIYFNQLSEDNFKGIAVLMLKELVGTLKDKDINFTWDETLLDYLVKKSYSAAYGARNLRRLIQKELEDAIAVRLIEGWQEPVSQLKAVSNGDQLELLAM
ncbi:ATP-dependent Clp protease ATP-binding subunit [Colidextribacter sp. OB.20]|uniref:ATP-dependent Clp protease ATP-binding subunit n=1 Tax=Colidextribacter sp. OB.20 TaxID=2304568 RepID=UPI00136E65AA|nr:ATP-dependent Clp protease ATP-binding subunit [Colidextribacter sp. OB.20]NBI08423.1 ATP-dependent Clp protease ATP-binding subunit [Colidextribacter sp. OB.20]